MRSAAADSAANRIAWVRLGLLALVLILAARAAHLTVLYTRAKTQGELQGHTQHALTPARGMIVDRDHRELAITTDAPSVYVIPRLVEDRSGTAAKLAADLGLDPAQVRDRMSERSGFTYIARWVNEAKAEQVAARKLPGVGIDREPRRRYPLGAQAAGLIGFADIDGRGVRGIEQLEEDWLRGRQRKVAIDRDAHGRMLALRSTNPQSVLGGDVALSLHAGMQAVAERALSEAIERHGARGGLAISVDPKTGDVLALADSPSFDPNHFRDVDYAGTRSRPFHDAVEPGSTLKAFLVAGALDAGAIGTSTVFETGDGRIRVPGKTIHDHHPEGDLDPAGVLRVSSNVGAVMIAQTLGAERQYASLQRFGFGQSTGSRFPMESKGLLRDWRDWQPVDQATIAFGQGINVTAMQLAFAMAALANGGERMAPRLVVERRPPLGEWRPEPTLSLGQAVSRDTADRVLSMLETVVSGEGTARLAGLSGMRVAGKTGTAQKLDRDTGRYSQNRYIAWFMGAAPAHDPELVIVVAIDEPSGALHTGGAVAAPIFAEIAAAQLVLKGVYTAPEPIPAPPLPKKTITVDAHERAPEPARAVVVAAATTSRPRVEPEPAPPRSETIDMPPALRENTLPPVSAAAAALARLAEGELQDPHRAVVVPDFMGRGLDAVRRSAARESLDLQVTGPADGRVRAQRPQPGTIVSGPRRTVRVELAPVREES